MLRLPNLKPPTTVAPSPHRERSTRSIHKAESRRPSRVLDGCAHYFMSEDDPLNTTFETPSKEIRYVVNTKGDPATASLRTAKTRVGYWDSKDELWEHVIGDIEWGGLARGDYVKSAMFERGDGYKIKTDDLLFNHPELSERVHNYTSGTRFFTVGGEDFMWKVDAKRRGLKLVRLSTAELYAEYTPGRRSGKTHLQGSHAGWAQFRIYDACAIDDFIVLLTFVVAEKLHRDAVSAEARPGRREKTRAAAGLEGAMDGGDGGGAGGA
ncbi:hypothetical protein PENSPDRAFT_651127 [Peniophora sp. CONT]|nr:hypothetical protein PENSPDRAFT_651127 [Peniophora sp. CONT]